MAVAINSQNREKENKESDFQKASALAQLIGSLYGTYDTAKSAPYKEAQGKVAMDQAEAIARRNAGSVNDADLLAHSEKYDISNEAPKDMTGVQKFKYVGAQSGGMPPVNPNDGSPLQQETYRYLALKKDKTLPYTIEKLKSDTALNYANAEKARRENDPTNPKKAWDMLPKEVQVGIEKVAGKQANQLSIANSIDSTINVLDNKDIATDQKLMQARQLIKTLNSQEGQDAVGAEEAKRLAGMIEFRVLNFTEPGAFIGRDLSGFNEQAKITANSLRDSAKANTDLIANMRAGNITQDKRYVVGNKPQFGKGKVNGADVFNVPTANASTPHPQDAQAVQWAKQNPQDPRSAAILKANGAP
jgi:hypothetical protein